MRATRGDASAASWSRRPLTPPRLPFRPSNPDDRYPSCPLLAGIGQVAARELSRNRLVPSRGPRSRSLRKPRAPASAPVAGPVIGCGSWSDPDPYPAADPDPPPGTPGSARSPPPSGPQPGTPQRPAPRRPTPGPERPAPRARSDRAPVQPVPETASTCRNSVALIGYVPAPDRQRVHLGACRSPTSPSAATPACPVPVPSPSPGASADRRQSLG